MVFAPKQLGGEPDFNPDGLLSRSHFEYIEGILATEEEHATS